MTKSVTLHHIPCNELEKHFVRQTTAGSQQGDVRTVTFTTDFQIILSRRCAYACGYCNFPETVSPTPPSPKAVRKMLSTASRLGAVQVTLTAGEGIESLPEIVSISRYYGFDSWAEYLRALCGEVLQWKGPGVFIPRLDVGALGLARLKRIAPVLPIARLMVHTADDELNATIVHSNSPHKNPATRFAAIEDLGRAQIPVVTGITIGLGESRESWMHAARRVSEIHSQFHNIHSFIVRPFEPQQSSPMADYPLPDDALLLKAIHTARASLDESIVLSAEIGGRLQLAAHAVTAGADDLEGLRVGTSEHLNFDFASTIDLLRKQLAGRGIRLCLRAPLNAQFAAAREWPGPVKRAISRYAQIYDKLRYGDRAQSECYEEQTAS